MKENEIGRVLDYYAKIGVVAIEITQGTLSVGDKLHFKGAHTDFYQEVTSMQIERTQVQTAKLGDKVGIKVEERVRANDKVLKVVED